MAASVYFNRAASKVCIYFLGIHYSWEYLNVKISHSKLFQGDYVFPGVSSLNKYWGVLFSGEYLLTVTPVCPDVYCTYCQLFSYDSRDK